MNVPGRDVGNDYLPRRLRPGPMAPPDLTDPKMRALRIPEETVVALEARMKGSSFPTVDEFAAFVLARLLEQSGEPGFSEEDERALKERLRSLGYID